MRERIDKHTEMQRQMEGQKQKLERERQRQRSLFLKRSIKPCLYHFPFLLALVSWAWEFLSSPSAFQPACGILKLCPLGHIPTGCWHHLQPASPCVHSAASPLHLRRALCSVLLGFLHLIYSILF